MLPVKIILCCAACSTIHSTVGPSMVSANSFGCMVKPVVNISGNTTICVAASTAAIFFSSMSKLRNLSSQKRSVCIRLMCKLPMLQFKNFIGGLLLFWQWRPPPVRTQSHGSLGTASLWLVWHSPLLYYISPIYLGLI